VIFDLDGTLVDSYAPITTSLNHARSFWRLPALSEDEVRRLVGHGLESLVALHVGANRVVDGVRLFREKYNEVFAEGTRALPGSLETLRSLHERGYRLAVASNKPARFSSRILDGLGVLRFLSCVVGPDNASATKPDPEMIRSCLAAMEVTAADALYVGDMVLDVESGARAGLPVLLVEGGSADPDELRRTNCPVLSSIGRLCEMLPDHPGG